MLKILLNNLREANRSSGGKMTWRRLWQKAKTPSNEASDVQYSLIVICVGQVPILR